MDTGTKAQAARDKPLRDRVSDVLEVIVLTLIVVTALSYIVLPIWAVLIRWARLCLGWAVG